MNAYLSKHGYVVKKDDLELDELFKIKEELRARPLIDEKFASQAGSLTFPLYIETKNKLYMPKMYGIQKFGMPTKTLPNYEGQSWPKEIPFVGTLRPEQAEPVHKLLDNLQQGSTGGILSLPTGGGKTFCALHVVSTLRRKTLIIVNKITLMKQWEKEINVFMPSARVGCIQGQKNVDVEDKDIVIAMLQSLARVDYPSSLLEDFGVTIVDEIHNTSTKVFTSVLQKACSKYTIGLSATPKRSDGCEYVFKWYIGDIVHQEIAERQGLPPIVYTVKVSSKEYKEIVNSKSQLQFTSMLSDLISMPKRNQLIIDLVKDLVRRDNRRVLVLSDRREHLKSLKLLLDGDIDVAFSYGLFVGQMKVVDLEKSKSSQVILATYQCFGEGVSEKDLDTLILATPKKFIGHLNNTSKNESGKLEQIVGRIFRKEHVSHAPIIVDMHDNFSVYKNQARQRSEFYKSHFKNAVLGTLKVDIDKEYEPINLSNVCTNSHTPNIQGSATAIAYTECLID